ncbi:MAG: hypothetical protein RLY31_2768 [Bacteroidota bacterium]|jgi:UDP-N-acetylmuramate--alanine ligase
MELTDIRKVYFLGIGGIGMSALARYFLSLGCTVHGYDRTRTPLTAALEDSGAVVHYGAAAVSLIPAELDLAVWTPAIPVDFEELVFLQNGPVPLMKRAAVLGLISRSHRTIAVAGTHGKTTTSAMITHLLRCGGVDCTAFLGGIAKNLGSNYVGGDSEWVVVEADEFDRSFLHLSPAVAVLLSMDPDHLDIYGDAAAIEDSGYREFVRRLEPGGRLFLNRKVSDRFAGQSCFSFGLEAGDGHACYIRVEAGLFRFDYVDDRVPANSMKDLELAMPGRHNVENATAAIAVAQSVGISEKAIREGLRTFQGIQRRFEFVYRDATRIFLDDYAHHPTEIRAAVQAARELFPGRRLTGVFQPHLYSRTRDFLDGFAEALSDLDEIWLLDIYPAREKPLPGITSALIFDKIEKADKFLLRKEDVLSMLAIRPTDVLMTIGAGDIDTLVSPIRQWMEQTTAGPAGNGKRPAESTGTIG